MNKKIGVMFIMVLFIGVVFLTGCSETAIGRNVNINRGGVRAEECSPGERKCGTQAECGNNYPCEMFCEPSPRGEGIWELTSCGEASCSEGMCEGCVRGSRVCFSDSVLSVCSEEGSWESIECGGDEVCREGRCSNRACTYNEVRCRGNAIQTCTRQGIWSAQLEECDGSEVCHEGACGEIGSLCGQDISISEDYELDGPLSCPGDNTILRLSGGDVVLNCNNFPIYGNTQIIVEGGSRNIIRMCRIQGIINVGEDGRNTVVEYNSVNGAIQDYGTGTVIEGNILHRSTPGAEGQIISMGPSEVIDNVLCKPVGTSLSIIGPDTRFEGNICSSSIEYNEVSVRGRDDEYIDQFECGGCP